MIFFTIAPSAMRLLLFLQGAFSLASGEWIDMSYLYDNTTITWGNLTPFQHRVVDTGKLNEHVPFFLVYDIELNEHAGTNIDAPVHFAEGKRSVDQIPPDDLVGQAVVVNISEKASKDRNAELTVDDLKMWEKKNGEIPDGSILLVFTDWGKYWPDYGKYLGTKSKNTSHYSFPGIHGKAAEWLVENRKVKGVGIDSTSIDNGKSRRFPSHQTFAKNNIYGLENVAHLDKLPTKGAMIYILPMNIKDGSGAPTRIFAKISGSSSIEISALLFLALLLGTLQYI